MSCHCISLSVRVYFAWRQACWQKYNSSSQTEVQKWQHTWNAVEAQLRHQSSGVSINFCGKSEQLTIKGNSLSRHVAMSSAEFSNPDATLWTSCEIQRTTASTQHHGGNRVDSNRERNWQTFCSLSENLQYVEFWICSTVKNFRLLPIKHNACIVRINW